MVYFFNLPVSPFKKMVRLPGVFIDFVPHAPVYPIINTQIPGLNLE
jgi:hypothetical protein